MSGKVARTSALLLVPVVVVSLSTASSAAQNRRAHDLAARSLRPSVPESRTIASMPAAVDPTAVAASWRGAMAETSRAFEAIARQGPNWPADPTGALGENWILTAVNTSYALFDLSGDPRIGPNALGALFDVSPGTQVFDPKVVYDQYDGRFILAFLAADDADQRSWIHIVTIPDATATDPSTWCGTTVVADRTAGDGRQYPDYTGLGYDASHVAVAANMYDYGRNRFRGATVLAFPKARLYDCSRKPGFDTFTGRETLAPTGDRGFGLQPSVSVGGGHSLYLTSLEPGRSSFVVLWRLTGTSGSMRLRSVALRVPRMRPAPFGTQGGAGVNERDAWWDTGDLRVTSSFADLDTGRVYAAHTVGTDLEPDGAIDYVESAVRWYELDPAGALGASRVLRVGTIGRPQTDAGWPSLATDVDGHLFVTYNRASALTNEYLSAWIAEIPPASTVATSQPLQSGTARFEADRGPERWGDYTAMSRDPGDGRFVMAVNQIAVSDGSGSTRDWRQVVHIVSHTA